MCPPILLHNLRGIVLGPVIDHQYLGLPMAVLDVLQNLFKRWTNAITLVVGGNDQTVDQLSFSVLRCQFSLAGCRLQIIRESFRLETCAVTLRTGTGN